MSNKEFEITICLGSSCFSRGNGTNLNMIKDYLKRNKLEDKVTFKGELCTGNCQNGPIIKINDKTFSKVSESNIENLLNEELSCFL